MSEATLDPDEALLNELADMVMSATRAAHARLMSAPDDDAFHAAGRTFQRMARSLRQTLALKARLKRDRAAERRDEHFAAQRAHDTRTSARKIALRAAIECARWDERERGDVGHEDIDDAIEVLAEAEDFTTADLPTLIARIKAILGFSPPAPDLAPAPSPEPALAFDSSG